MPKYIRVKSVATKHEFDVPEGDSRIKDGVLTPIKSDRYPPVDSPRRAKHHITSKRSAAAAESPKEPTNG